MWIRNKARMLKKRGLKLREKFECGTHEEEDKKMELGGAKKEG